MCTNTETKATALCRISSWDEKTNADTDTAANLCTNTYTNTYKNTDAITGTNTYTDTETKATALCRNSSLDEETVICFAGRVPGAEIMIFTSNAMRYNAIKCNAMQFLHPMQCIAM